MPLAATKAIAEFDSAAAMLRALGRFLHGEDFPGLGINRLQPRPASVRTRAIGASPTSGPGSRAARHPPPAWSDTADFPLHRDTSRIAGGQMRRPRAPGAARKSRRRLTRRSNKL